MCEGRHRINLWKRRTNTFVKPARGHTDTHFSDNAKRYNEFGLRHLRSADKQLSAPNIDIAVTFCGDFDKLLFWDESICDWH